MISDFLFEDASERIKELAELNSVHDVFLVMIDSAFAFELPDVSAGWINAFDIETGESRLMSRRELRGLASRVRAWQDELEREAHERGLDVLRIGVDRGKESAGPPGIRHGEAVEESMNTQGLGIRD